MLKVWLFLAGKSKIRRERNHVKINLLSKKELEFKELENSQLMHLAKNEKAC
jgi:hypothetical protein